MSDKIEFDLGSHTSSIANLQGPAILSGPAKDTTAQHLAAIVESSDDAILTKDLNGIITSWNRGAERLFGYAAEEALGRSVTMLIPSDRPDEEPGILRRLRRGEKIDHYETVRQRKDGSLIHISLSVSPLRDDNGTIIGASKIARDITDRQNAHEQQQLLLKEMSRTSSQWRVG
jgi:PAS domain S-box-containing protein